MNCKSLLLFMMCLPLMTVAQTQINKSYALQNGQSIVMHFDYPELVRVSTWEKNEVSIQGTVSINGGENDDAFIIENSTDARTLSVRSYIKDLKSIPERVTVYHEGQKIIFTDKAAMKKYQQEHGVAFNTMSFQPDIDIFLEIKVPANVVTKIESVYGMVEVKNFKGPLTVDATYGGVDAALSERSVGEIVAETNFGEIFTNWDIKFGGQNSFEEDFHTLVVAKPGTGPKYTLGSKYGNVYIRKALN